MCPYFHVFGPAFLFTGSVFLVLWMMVALKGRKQQKQLPESAAQTHLLSLEATNTDFFWYSAVTIMVGLLFFTWGLIH